MLFLSYGITELLKNKREGKQDRSRHAALYIESALKSLIVESLSLQGSVVDVPEVKGTIQAIMDRLLSVTDPQPYDIEVLVLNSTVVNALTFPGGLIVVYSGLINSLDSAEEMAAVLAHELGHVVNRDSMKSLSRQIGLSIFFSLFGGRNAQVLVERLIREATNIRFSRAVESRADDYALDLLTAAEIDPANLGAALDNLKKENKHELGTILKYIDSHPEIDTRIKKAYEKSSLPGEDYKPFEINWNEVKNSLPPIRDLFR
jgi:predicted Zn-dependent protease